MKPLILSYELNTKDDMIAQEKDIFEEEIDLEYDEQKETDKRLLIEELKELKNEK